MILWKIIQQFLKYDPWTSNCIIHFDNMYISILWLVNEMVRLFVKNLDDNMNVFLKKKTELKNTQNRSMKLIAHKK